jgi:hypothetical protein
LGLFLSSIPLIAQTVPIQHLALNLRQVEAALDYLGEPLTSADQQHVNEALATTNHLT